MKIPITKYHGCGNDFIIAEQADLHGMDHAELAVVLCDRHTGIGADGFIAVQRDPLEMIFYNQDGSRAPMCGNGIRCFSAYCYDHHIVEEKTFDVETLAGIQKVTIEEINPYQVCVDMGTPKEDLSLLGIKQPIWDLPLTLNNGQEVKLYTIFMGTIHTVIFTKLDAVSMEEVGREICEHPLFEKQTNVNFVEIIDQEHMRMRTYERGCGMTLACGTGACASLVCAARLKKLGNKATAILPKGELHLAINTNGHIMMSGPAVCIMKGEYAYAGN